MRLWREVQDWIKTYVEDRLKQAGVGRQSINAGSLTGVIDTTIVSVPHDIWSTHHTDVNTADARSDGDVLTWHAGTSKWLASPASGFSNPMTSVGDLIRGGTAGAPTRLAIGSTGQVLGVSGGIPAWMATTATGSRWEPLSDGIAASPAIVFEGLNGDVIMVEVFS